MAGPIGPLITDPKIPLDEENKKALALFTAAVLAIRFAPQTLAPIARYGLGLTVSAETGAISAGPFALTNLLPAPFGFVPARNYGLTPNFYLPAGVADDLPAILPGVKEQRAAEAQQRAFGFGSLQGAAVQAEPINFPNFSDQALRRKQAALTNAQGQPVDAQAALTIGNITAELARRADEAAQENAERIARLGIQTEAKTVAGQPANPFSGGAFADSGERGAIGTATATGSPGRTPGGGAVTVTDPAPGAPIGGITGAIGTAEGAARGAAAGSFGELKRDNLSSQFPDKYFSITAGDP